MESFRPAFTMDIRRLRVLRELQERGTVGATAEALNLTPSAVSQQIAALAREAGVPLLAPLGRRVRLTPQALLLLEHAGAIDRQLERARTELAAFQAGEAGRVGLGAFGTAIAGIVAPAMARLRRERPRLTLAVTEVEAPDCFSKLDAGELDLVIAVQHHGGPSRTDPRYVRRELLRDPLMATLPASHPLAAATEVHLEALAGDSWVVGAVRTPCQEVALAACTEAGFSPAPSNRVNDWTAVAALVAAGCGVALVPRLALPAGVPPGAVLRPLAGPRRPCRSIFAAVRGGSEKHPGLAPVLDALAAAAREWSEAP
jgi:DNA-binding transcriptional LysR family regulator